MGLRPPTVSIRPNFMYAFSTGIVSSPNTGYRTTTPTSTRTATISTLERFSALLLITLFRTRQRAFSKTRRLLPTRIPYPTPPTSTPPLLKETTAGRSLTPQTSTTATTFLTATRSEPKLAQFPFNENLRTPCFTHFAPVQFQ